MRVAAGLLLLAVAAAAPAALALDVRTEEYRAAATAGKVAPVEGRAIEEARRRSEPDAPLGGFNVTLLPRSEEFLARLRDIQQRARTDMRAYRDSANAIVAERRRYERELADGGASDLVRYAAVAADGRFSVDGVPAGDWILIALRPVFFPKETSAKQQTPRNRQGRPMYAPSPRLKGYYAVAVWLRELTVTGGETEAVELNDRNIWMTAIEEERVPDAGR